MGYLEIFTKLDSLIFTHLSQAPKEVSGGDIERFVVLLHSRTSHIVTVNAARKQLFSYGNRKLEIIPPSRAALLQHVNCASFQAGHIWGQALIAKPFLQIGVGWKKRESGHHCGQHSQETSNGCRELVKCNCMKHCLGRCKCHKTNLKCMQLCFCGGQ